MHYSKPRPQARTAKLVLQAALLIAVSVSIAAAAHAAVSGIAPQVAPAIPRLDQDRPAEMGFVPPASDLSHIRAPLASTPLTLSARFEWRESGGVTPVKDQGSCGSCYAFAALANAESRMLIAGQGTFDLSENSVKECEYFGSSCGGGNDWIVAHYLSTKGTVLEACDPYTPANVDCNGICPFQQTLLGWNVISSEAVPSVDVLKSYIQTYGPVYTAMYAGNRDAWYTEYQEYDGSYTLYYTGTQAPNHAVLIVGWDDDLVHAGGTGGWIVKNSWGTSWGGTCGYGSEGGYFTIAYGSAQIGSYSSFFDQWQVYDPNGTLLYLDEGGFTGSVGYGDRTIWGMCKFVPQHDCMIQRVEFWTLDATSDVDVYIYDSLNGRTVSGLVASEVDNSFSLAGYHSIQLATPIRVNRDDDIYVVAKITDVTSTFPMAFDAVGPTAPGSCFISPTGTSYTEFPDGDLGIRLRVTNAVDCAEAGEAPVVTGVADVPGDSGGYVKLAWTRSSLDSDDGPLAIRVYRIWRKRQQILPGGLDLGADDGPSLDGPHETGSSGPAWEAIAKVPATGQCSYELAVPTDRDTSEPDTAWTYFYISAHTGAPGEHFDSPVVMGHSIDDGGTQAPSDGGSDETTSDGLGETRIALGHPEPNPSIEGVTLRFETANPGHVSLTIHDVTGRRVAVLVDGFVDGGSHVARWQPGRDGTPAQAPGLYFARLTTADQVRTTKLVLTR